MSTPLHIAQQVIRDEADALQQLATGLNGDFDAMLETIMSTSGQVIVSGLGKSGNIAQKIAASLTSTGQPAMFMHPVEALHGDLGIVTPQHCLIALSRSGNTDEILRLVSHFRKRGGPVIGVTQNPESRLAELCRHLLLLPNVPEAGPLNLAPTTSCVMMLAIGDALAMALLHKRGFRREDFAEYHPEGSLGRRLLLRAADLMHAEAALPVVPADATFNDLIVEMTEKRLGVALIVEADGRLMGTFTDGDLRRVFERVEDPRKLDAGGAYRHSRRTSGAPPVTTSTILPTHLAVDALRIMQTSQITSLVVTDDQQRPVGLLRLMDLLEAGLG